MLLLTYDLRCNPSYHGAAFARAADPDNPARTFPVYGGHRHQCPVCRDYGSVQVGNLPMEGECFTWFETCPRCGDELPPDKRAPEVLSLYPYVLVAAEAFGLHDRVRSMK